MKKVYGYARVSTKEQNLDRQLKALRDSGVHERDIITDKASGKSLDREGYKVLKEKMLRDGDTLVIKSLDRLSRNKAHIKQELEYFRNHHIRVKVLDLPTTAADYPAGQEWVFDMINNVLIEVLSSIAEQEREAIKQRQAEGIAAAQAMGKHLGRPAAQRPENWEKIFSAWQDGEITATEAAKLAGVGRTTFYKLVNMYSG